MRSVTRKSLWAAAAGLTALLTSSSSVSAQDPATTNPSCRCGYADYLTGELYTDRTITYFNETGAQENVVWESKVAPSFQGTLSSGDSGTGPEDWAVGEQRNDWEDAFGSTWVSGVRYNNTFLPANPVNGLAMTVPPAIRRNRTSFGSLIVSRRRDIRYGTFRVAIDPASSNNGGTLLQMAVWYNQSHDILTNIVTTDAPDTAFLQWDYSATGRDSQPVNMNLTSGGGIGFQMREHRIDWLPTYMNWSNNAPETIPYQQVFDDKKVFVPSVAMPFSIKHYSNGDSRLMEGPPRYRTATAYIPYVRLFYNSSREERHAEFEQDCAANPEPACDVDSLSMRGSTPFAFEATTKQTVPKPKYAAPLYSKIITAASGGLFIIIVMHALARRYINKRKKEAEYLAQLREGEKQYSLNIIQQASGFNTPAARDLDTPNGSGGYYQRSIRAGSSPDGSEPPQLTIAGNASLQSGAQTPATGFDAEYAASVYSFDTKHDDADALAKWDDPRYMRDSDSDDSDSDDDDIKDDPLNPNIRSVRRDLDSFGHGAFSVAHGADSPTGAMSVQTHGGPMSVQNHGSAYIAPEYRINSSGTRSAMTHSVSHGFLSAAQSDRNHGPSESEEDLNEPSRRPSGLNRVPSGRSRLARSARLGRSATSEWDLNSADGHISINGIALSRDHRRPSLAPSYSQSVAHSVADTMVTQDLPGLSQSDRLRWAGGLTGIGAPDSDAGHQGPYGPWGEGRRGSLPGPAQSFVSLEGRDHAVKWETKITEWAPLQTNEKEQGAGQLAEPASGKSLLPEKPGASAAVPAKKKGAIARFGAWLHHHLIGEIKEKATASGAARVEYLDGLRGFACFLVSFHHFMLIWYYHATTPAGQAHYLGFENMFHFILGPILINGGLNIGIFFVLSARVIANRYVVRGKLQDLAEASYRRVPRLAVPISAAIIINYFLIQAQAFAWTRKLASRTWSTWSYYHDYQNVGFFFNSWLSLWFVVPPDVPLLISTYATGILWTVPIMVQTSWTVFTCALIAREFANPWKRFGFYFSCLALAWWNNRFDYFFIAGLMIADADNKLKYRQWAAKGIPLVPGFLQSCMPKRLAKIRVHGQIIGWITFLAGLVTSWLYFVGEEFKDENGRSMYGAMFNQLEWGIHPNYATGQPWGWGDGAKPTYIDPRLHDFFFVIGFFLLCDLCPTFRIFFQLKFWKFFGRNAFSIYLCHGVAFWSWGAWLTLILLQRGVEYWVVVTIVFITSYIILFLMCEAFTRTFDVWGIGVSKAIWRAQSGGLGRRI